jgi:hypothetical protein
MVMALHYGTTPTCGCPYDGPYVAPADKGHYSYHVHHLPRCAQYDPEETARRRQAEQDAKDYHAWR